MLQPVPFPIPYQGSKRRIAAAILEWFPQEPVTLFEPFCGSAAVSLAALASGRAAHVHLNDTNDGLVQLWRAIVEQPDVLAEGYRKLWHAQLGREREFYDEVRDDFNASGGAVRFLYLLARCVKAAVRYNGDGQFNQSPDNRRSGARPDRMEQHIVRASSLLAGRSEIACDDFRAAVERATPDDVVYMDPPYQGVSTNRDRRYRDPLTYDEFCDALAEFNRRSLSYIVSYDGRTGTKTHGSVLPASLRLHRIEIHGGRSTQETLLGRVGETVESLYLSAPLMTRRAQM